MRPLSIRVLGTVLGLVLLLPASASARVVVSLEFDDATADQASLGPVLAARGMHATFFVNSGLLGTDGFMTVPQLLALQAQGHEIGGHTVTHADLPGLSSDGQVFQICADRKQLLAQGLNATDFAYPNGSYSTLTQALASYCGYQSARTVGFVACPGCGRAEALPPLDPFATRTLQPPAETWTTLVQLKRAVTKAERGRRYGWLQIVFHEVCDGCAPGSVSALVLGGFLDWLRLRSARTPVMTVREALTQPPRARPRR